MVRQAREMVAAGELGQVVAVHASYIQDWLTRPIDLDGQKQAEWRTDPARAGQSAVLADIGVHAYNLACFVSGATAEAVAADLFTAVPGRRLDDNANLLVRWTGGARGTLVASQTSPGHYNDLTVSVYGDRAGLVWAGSRPEELRFAPYGEEARALVRGGHGAKRRGAGGVTDAGGASGGVHRGFRQPLPRRRGDDPGAPDRRAGRSCAGGAGARRRGRRDGVRFVAAAVASAAAGGAWTRSSAGGVNRGSVVHNACTSMHKACTGFRPHEGCACRGSKGATARCRTSAAGEAPAACPRAPRRPRCRGGGGERDGEADASAVVRPTRRGAGRRHGADGPAQRWLHASSRRRQEVLGGPAGG